MCEVIMCIQSHGIHFDCLMLLQGHVPSTSINIMQGLCPPTLQTVSLLCACQFLCPPPFLPSLHLEQRNATVYLVRKRRLDSLADLCAFAGYGAGQKH